MPRQTTIGRGAGVANLEGHPLKFPKRANDLSFSDRRRPWLQVCIIYIVHTLKPNDYKGLMFSRWIHPDLTQHLVSDRQDFPLNLSLVH
jgi:hypothetical protein